MQVQDTKRAALLATAETMFSRFGARRVTVEELCRQAGTSKMTFYRHFRNKKDLVRQLHDELVESGFAKFDEINARDIPFPEKVVLMGQWKQEYMSRLSLGFYRELIDVEHSTAEYKRRYLQNIEAGQRAGDVRDDVNPEFLWQLLEKVGELFAEGTWQKSCKDLGDAQRQLRTIVWYGLLVRKGETS
jgi:AcrR family transcriptional regulator